MPDRLHGISGLGVAPYGVRHSGLGAKGKGFFGLLATPSGAYASEYSIESDGREMPTLVPTLTADEVQSVLNGQLTPQIIEKARAFAQQRQSAGKNAFAQPNELRYPDPRAAVAQAMIGQ